MSDEEMATVERDARGEEPGGEAEEAPSPTRDLGGGMSEEDLEFVENLGV